MEKDKTRKEHDFIEDPRYKQCNREAVYGILLGIANLIWWYVFGYGMGSKPVEEYKYILGFPDWFFFSCILSAVVFTILTYVMINKLFKNMSLEEMTEEEALEYEREYEGGRK